MHQNQDSIYMLIGKKLSNELDQAEQQQLNEWLEKSEENKKLYDNISNDNEIIYLYKDLKNLNKDKARELTWMKIKEIEKMNEETEKRIYNDLSKKFRRSIIRYAAVIILIISIGWGSFTYFNISSKNNVLSLVQISAPKGSRTNVLLADGTSVWLNAGSILKYANDYNKKNRVVFLEGEAFFDVKKNPHKPFFVKTPFLNMRVVGTTFNVKSYPEEGITQTTLVTGTVVLERESDKETGSAPVILKPNQRATFINSQNKMIVNDVIAEKSTIVTHATPLNIVKENINHKDEIIIADKINVEKDISWKDGYLVIEHESLENLVITFARRYDVTFVFQSEDVKKYKYTGKINDLTLDQVLNAIKISSPIDYHIEGKIVKISKKNKYK